jgi:hypothetical protein
MMSDKEYHDENGILHVPYDHHLCVVWRQVMKQHMDVCYDNGLNAGTAATLLLNGAAYLLAAYYQNEKEKRIATAEEMAKVFLAKVEQSVDEIRRDRSHGS